MLAVRSFCLFSRSAAGSMIQRMTTKVVARNKFDTTTELSRRLLRRRRWQCRALPLRLSLTIHPQ